MKDRLRLLPRDFLYEWILAFGTLPPEDFLETYETTYEALYYGFQTREPGEEGKRKNTKRSDYSFADPSFLWVTKQANRQLRAIAAALSRRRKQDRARGARRHRQPDRMADGATSGEEHLARPV